MKVLLWLMLAFSIAGCCEEEHAKEGQERKETPTAQVLNKAYISFWGSISSCEFEGHKYVLYNADRGGGIVHHPDCKCKERKAK